jgi:hypothetical protein
VDPSIESIAVMDVKLSEARPERPRLNLLISSDTEFSTNYRSEVSRVFAKVMVGSIRVMTH